MLYRQLQNLSKGVYGILTTDWISFHVPDVVIRCKHYSNGIIGDF